MERRRGHRSGVLAARAAASRSSKNRSSVACRACQILPILNTGIWLVSQRYRAWRALQLSASPIFFVVRIKSKGTVINDSFACTLGWRLSTAYAVLNHSNFHPKPSEGSLARRLRKIAAVPVCLSPLASASHQLPASCVWWARLSIYSNGCKPELSPGFALFTSWGEARSRRLCRIRVSRNPRIKGVFDLSQFVWPSVTAPPCHRDAHQRGDGNERPRPG